MPSRPVVLATLLVLPGASCYTFPNIFGPPRTRARALGYANKAVFKPGELEHTSDSNTRNVGGALDDVKNPLPVRAAPRSKVGMMLSPDDEPGSVDAPGELLPVASLACYAIRATTRTAIEV